MKKYFIYVALFGLGFALSCKKDKKNDVELEVSLVVNTFEAEKIKVKKTYADIAFAVYDDAYLGVIELKSAINSFVANPTQNGFQLCKQKWLAVREVYGLSETFRFAEGPIDNTADGPEGLINAWPMDEAYVDYVVNSNLSGIVNDSINFPLINASVLLAANENGGEENISLGFHAIEFLLWGQDLSANSPGLRPYTDYLETGGTASNQMRRGQYLNTTVAILLSGLKQVRDAWDPNMNNSYYKTFLDLDNTAALRKMFNSLRVLSGFELSGERIYTAYNNMDQEDEHSCFSDNTHRDIYLNAKGMQNLYNGMYTRTNLAVVEGYALKDLMQNFDATKNSEVQAELNSAISKISMMYIPFDQAIIISNERPKVLASVNALQVLEAKINSIAATVGITF